MSKIRFDWNDKTYEVSKEAYDFTVYILLPDELQTVLKVGAWDESFPPKPFLSWFDIAPGLLQPTEDKRVMKADFLCNASLAVGTKVQVMVDGVIKAVHNSHGLCYEVEFPRNDYTEPRIYNFDDEEIAVVK